VPGVDLESVPLPGRPGESHEQFVGGLDRSPAVLADEVAVRSLGKMVGGRPVPEVGVDHHAEPLEFVEVPVHGGQCDVGSVRLNPLGQILDGPVSRTVEERLEQEPPRGGDPSAVLAHQSQHVVDRVDLVEVVVDRE